MSNTFAMPRFDLDQSPESRTYLEQFAGSHRYFSQAPPVRSAEEGLQRLQSDDISLVLEIPPNFGRDFRRGSRPEVLAQVDGANTFRGETVSQYAQGVHNTMLRDPASGLQTRPDKYTANIQDRYMYNPTFESIYSIVPSVPALLLVLIPAILMTVSIVREKELGSMINFYVTPTGRMEYLLGKQLPYIAIGMLNFFILVAMALVVFRRPDQGKLSDVDVVHAALRHGDNRHRHGDFDLHQQPGRRRLRHRDSHHCADHPVLRFVAAGLDT